MNVHLLSDAGCNLVQLAHQTGINRTSWMQMKYIVQRN